MITVHQGDNSDISETLLNNYIVDNFKWGLTNIELTNLNDFLEEAKEKKMIVSKYKHHGGHKYYIENDDLFITLYHYSGEKFYIDYFTKTKEHLDSFYEEKQKYLKKEKDVQISKSSFYFSERGLETKEEFYELKDFDDIIKEYYPDFIDLDEFFKQFMKSEESIFILAGKPGTGKSKFFTYMMKYLLANPELVAYKSYEDEEYQEVKYVNVGYLKDETILAIDQFWITLIEREYDLLILDDLDYFLSPRTRQVSSDEEVKKDKFISQLLSFTDGITPNKTKFLISTNKDIDSVDDALLREGRLFGIFAFDELTNEQALGIWEQEGLSKEAFKAEFDGKSVLQAKLGSKIKEYKRNNGKASNPFLKEGSTIDISNKFKRKSKIGF